MSLPSPLDTTTPATHRLPTSPPAPSSELPRPSPPESCPASSEAASTLDAPRSLPGTAAQASLGLLDLPPSPGAANTEGFDWGASASEPTRGAAVLTFEVPRGGEGMRERRVSLDGVGSGPAMGEATGVLPTTRKTSGTPSWIRRAKSFGTSPVLPSGPFVSTPSLPHTPPMSSPALTVASAKGKERSAPEPSSHWLFSPPKGEKDDTTVKPRKNQIRRSTFSLFKRGDSSTSNSQSPSLNPSANPSARSSAHSLSLPTDLPSTQATGSIQPPSLPSLQLSASSHRLSWAFGASPPKTQSPRRTTWTDAEIRRGRQSGEMSESPVEEKSEELGGLGLGLGLGLLGTPGGREESAVRAARSKSDVGPQPPGQGDLEPPRMPLVGRSRSATPNGSSGSSTGRPGNSRKYTPNGSSSSVFGAVSNFLFSSSAGSSTPPAETSEFGALFGSPSKISTRNRGMSAGTSLFGPNIVDSKSRKRAGSTSSLARSRGPPLTVGGSLLAPDRDTSISERERMRTFSTASNTSSSRLSVPPVYSPGMISGSPSIQDVLFSPPESPVSVMVSEKTRIAREQRSQKVKVEEGEEPEGYIKRLMDTVNKSEIARILSSKSDSFHAVALTSYLSTFEFYQDSLDIGLRKFLMQASLPTETQQIDRVMEAFAIRYTTCNPSLFPSSDTPYVLAFSLVMLSTDQFNPSNKNKMTKADYVKNTKVEGVSIEILEYFYDQITIAPFVFVEGESDSATPPQRPELPSTTSSSFFSKNSALQKEKARIDPYHLIAQGLTNELRVDIESLIPLKSPFSFTGTTSFFNATSLHTAFLHAPILQISAGPRNKLSGTLADSPLTPTMSNSTFATPTAPEYAISSLKITKIGLLSRKEDLVEGGKKAASRKWKEWSVILTGSQLLFFKDPSWAATLKHAVDAAVKVEGGTDSSRVLVYPALGSFKPDAVLSLAHSAAIYDTTYAKYPNVFRLIAPAGRQYLFQAQNDDDLNSWLAHINYAASFKSASLRMRGSSNRPHSPNQPGSPPALFALQQGFPGSPNLMGPLLPDDDPHDSPFHPTSLSHAFERGMTPSSSVPSTMTSNSSRRMTAVDDFGAPIRRLDSNEAFLQHTASRAEILRIKIASLEEEIRSIKTSLHLDLCRVRNLSVLTPFLRSTRERIQAAAVPIEKRVRHARMNLIRVICYRQVLARDLIVEDRESQRSRKASTPSSWHAGSHPPSRRTSRGDGYATSPLSSPPPLSRQHHPLIDRSENPRQSFESQVDPAYQQSLTDDELDRLRSPPLVQRSTTETEEDREDRTSADSPSDEELPPISPFRRSHSSPTLGSFKAASRTTTSTASSEHTPSTPSVLSDPILPAPSSTLSTPLSSEVHTDTHTDIHTEEGEEAKGDEDGGGEKDLKRTVLSPGPGEDEPKAVEVVA